MEVGTRVGEAQERDDPRRPPPSHECRALGRSPRRVGARALRRRTPPQVLGDEHRDHEVGERDEPRPDRPAGGEPGADPTQRLVVLRGAEHPDDEQDRDRELGEHEDRGGGAHEVVGIVGPLHDVAEVPVVEVTHDRDPVGERHREQRRCRHHQDEEDGERHGEAALVAPPGRGGRDRRRWWDRQRRRRWRRRRR